MAGPDNAKNELLEMSAANAWPAPQFAYVPGDVNPFRCQVTQVVPMRAAPFVATGISCMTNKGAEKEAAAVMLAEVADYFAQQGAIGNVSDDYPVNIQGATNYINSLQELTDVKFWGYPAYKKLPCIVNPPHVAGIATFVTVHAGVFNVDNLIIQQGAVCSSRSSRRAAKDAKQEAAARLLVHLAALGHVQLAEIPAELHSAAMWLRGTPTETEYCHEFDDELLASVA